MQFPLELNEAHVRKLVNNHPIQLTHKQLMGNKHHLVLHMMNHKKLSQAKSKGKGVRVTLSPQELHDTINGGGFGDLWNKIKKGASWLKQNIISTPFYQSAVRPVLHGLSEAAVSAASPMLGPVAPILKAGVEKLGETTQAFGLPNEEKGEPMLKMSQPKPKRAYKPRAKKAMPSTPVPKPKAKRAPKPKPKGGSFLIG